MLGRHSKLEHNRTNSICHKQKRRQTERYKHRRTTVKKRDRGKGREEKTDLEEKRGREEKTNMENKKNHNVN
jgi:hypothetical protein